MRKLECIVVELGLKPLSLGRAWLVERVLRFKPGGLGCLNLRIGFEQALELRVGFGGLLTDLDLGLRSGLGRGSKSAEGAHSGQGPLVMVGTDGEDSSRLSAGSSGVLTAAVGAEPDTVLRGRV